MTHHQGRRARPFAVLLVLVALAALAGPAAASDVGPALRQPVDGSPVGGGAVNVAVEGSLLSVRHDRGATALPGDDRIAASEGAEEVDLHWAGAPLGASFTAGFGGFEVRHGAAAALADAANEVFARLPDPAPRLLLQASPEGANLRTGPEDAWVFPGPLKVWPATWWGMGWGVGYDRVNVPGDATASSDEAIAWRAYTLGNACGGTPRALGLELPACAELGARAIALLPEVVVHARLDPDAAFDLGGVVAPAGAALAGEAGPHPLVDEGVPRAASDSLDRVEAVAAPAWPAVLAPEPLAGRSEPRSAEPLTPASLAAGSSDAVLGLALPLLLAGAAALLLPFLALYRRIQPHRTLQHPVRNAILEQVRAHPGIHESALARALGLHHTHVQYHLRILEEAGILEARRFGGLKCLFELGRHSLAEKAHAMADRGRGHEVLRALGEEPGIAQRALARRLGMSESSVKWHLQRLEASGLVRTERTAGAKRAWVLPSVLPPLPAPPAGVLAVPAPPRAMPPPA